MLPAICLLTYYKAKKIAANQLSAAETAAAFKKIIYLIDMGPGGGEAGGTIVATGTVNGIKNCPESVTGRFI